MIIIYLKNCNQYVFLKCLLLYFILFTKAVKIKLNLTRMPSLTYMAWPLGYWIRKLDFFQIFKNFRVKISIFIFYPQNFYFQNIWRIFFKTAEINLFLFDNTRVVSSYVLAFSLIQNKHFSPKRKDRTTTYNEILVFLIYNLQESIF